MNDLEEIVIIEEKQNKLIKKHVDNLKAGYYVLVDMLGEIDSPWISDKLARLIQETKEEARDIYMRSSMKVPDWCRFAD